MKRIPDAPQSLQTLLQRAHLLLALTAVGVVGLLLAIPAVATLHAYSERDLNLLGRAISYTVEAAVVFGDREAAQEDLVSIVATEDVALAVVRSADGHELARWERESTGWSGRLGAVAARLVLERPAQVPVMHQGGVIGSLEVRGGGRTLLRFMALGAIGIATCQVLIALGAAALSRRMVRQIVPPLQRLAQITGTVQRERAFARRVPTAEIAELNDLGLSFNALLAELEAWQGVMETENQLLSHQATHDSLTGLSNRAFFEGRLNRALAEAAQSGTVLAVVFADCNRFKQINDAYGHQVGDEILVGVAARLRGQVRERDLVSRLGGDEFAILLAPGSQKSDSPHGRSQQELASLVAGLAQPMDIPVLASTQGSRPIALPISLSVGLAIFPQDGTSAAALLQRADAAMYRAKRARRE